MSSDFLIIPPLTRNSPFNMQFSVHVSGQPIHSAVQTWTFSFDDGCGETARYEYPKRLNVVFVDTNLLFEECVKSILSGLVGDSVVLDENAVSAAIRSGLTNKHGAYFGLRLTQPFNNDQFKMLRNDVLIGVNGVMFDNENVTDAILDAALHGNTFDTVMLHYVASDAEACSRHEIVVPYSRSSKRIPNAEAQTLKRTRIARLERITRESFVGESVRLTSSMMVRAFDILGLLFGDSVLSNLRGLKLTRDFIDASNGRVLLSAGSIVIAMNGEMFDVRRYTSEVDMIVNVLRCSGVTDDAQLTYTVDCFDKSGTFWTKMFGVNLDGDPFVKLPLKSTVDEKQGQVAGSKTDVQPIAQPTYIRPRNWLLFDEWDSEPVNTTSIPPHRSPSPPTVCRTSAVRDVGALLTIAGLVDIFATDSDVQ